MGPDEEVRTVLESVGLGELAPRFAAEDVDATLLWSLEDGDLRDLGLTLGQRKKLLERLKAGRSAADRESGTALPEPEFRRITVLFSDLVGYTELTQRLDPDDMRGLLQRYHAAARDAARQHGGFIASVQGDGVVMLFGFPTAQTASAERAIGAAHAVLARLRGLQHRLASGETIDLEARVGIASGKAIVGFGPDYAGGEPQMVGPVINRAARLQATAPPGGVVVDEATRALAAAAFAFDALPEAALKGFGQKVPVALALPQGVPPGPPRSIDPAIPSAHEAERGRLAEAWRAARPPQPAMVLLSGEAGIGKSTLVAQFAAELRGAGAQVKRLSCMALSANVPLRPVIDLLDTLLGTAADSAVKVRFEQLERLFAWATPAERSAVAVLMGLGGVVPGGVTATQLDRRLLLSTLARFLMQSEAAALLVVVEDVHWADATTRELLAACADTACETPVMLLATSREAEDPVWRAESGPLQVPLSPVTEDAARRVLAHHLAGRDLPEAINEAIVTRSAGNPLMLEALARWAHDWTVAQPGQEFEVPDSIYESISARLDALPSGRKVTAALSVFDEPTEERVLAATLGMTAADLGPALAELARARIIERRGGSAAASVRFSHSLYREVAYERLVKSAREGLHRSAFAALTRSHADLARQRPGHLAWHAHEGGDHASAAPLAVAAGEQALQRSALMEATHFLRQAEMSIERMGEGEKTDPLRLRVLIAQSSISRARLGIASEEAGRLGREVLELAQKLRETRSELIALTGLYTHALVRAEYAAAGKWAGLLHAKAEQAQDRTFRMIGRRGMGVVALHTGALAEAALALQEALDSYDEAQHLPLAHSHGYDHAEISSAFLSYALWISGDPVGGLAASEFSVSHSRRIRHHHSLAQALIFRSMLLLVAGDWQQCLAAAQECAELGRRHDLGVMRSAGGFFVMGVQLLMREAPPAAAEYAALNQKLADFRRMNPYNYQQVIGIVLAQLYLRSGSPAEADAALQQSEAVQNRTRETFLEPELMRLRAQILRASGEEGAARDALAAALQVAEKMGARMLALRIACDMAEADPSAETLARLAAARRKLTSQDEGWDLMRCQALLPAVTPG
ncbi:AAA family ATPase [Aestuariivirga litoralis]|uniref:AAA family ATPase n=1 Tax=Aestuariivirga litoralis TaxID=2650924 RepID=UPI00137A391E|nr:AAA family ATPase [Aestuariivirga litoralis]